MQYFGVNYRAEPFEEMAIQPWAPTSLPKKNLFVPTDFKRRAELRSEQPKPERLEPLYSCWLELWFQPEIVHNEPIATVRWCIPVESVVESFETRVLAIVYTTMLKNSLSRLFSAAERCGIQFNVSADAIGIAIYIRGNPGSVISLAEPFFDHIANFVPSSKRFILAVKERLEFCERGQDTGSILLASQNSVLFTQHLAMPREAEAEILQDLTHEKLSTFSLRRGCFRSKIVCFASGDLRREDAYRLAELAEDKLQPLEVRSSIIARPRVVKLPKGTTRVTHVYPSRNEAVNALRVTMQIPARNTHRMLAILHVFNALAGEYAHDALRTEQQLCYYVQIGGWANCGGGIEVSLSIGSEKHSTDVLSERVDAWLETLPKFFSTIPEDRLKTCIDSGVKRYTEEPASHSEREMKSWRQIWDEKFDFDEDAKIVKCISKIDRSKIVHFVEKYLLPRGSKTRRIVSTVNSRSCPVPKRAGDFKRSDFEKFHQTRPLYALRQPVSDSIDIDQ